MDPAVLREMARDRRQVTPELHAPNDFYGHAAVLKRYVGLPPQQPLKAVIEHGVSLLPRIWHIDLRAPLPTFLCAGEARASLYERGRPRGLAVPIGPMIHYVDDRPPAPRPRGRLLAFPAHSTHLIKATYDARAFAQLLAGYRDRFSEIVVCLYWKDVLDGADGPYRAEGFECVTAGHMFDHAFLQRLRDLIEQAGTVITNQFGSYVPYAIALDRPVWLHSQELTLTGAPKDVAREVVPASLLSDTTREIRRAFADEVDEVVPTQRAFLEPMVGFEKTRSREELSSILSEAAERYRRQTSRAGRATHYVVARMVRPVVEMVR